MHGIDDNVTNDNHHVHGIDNAVMFQTRVYVGPSFCVFGVSICGSLMFAEDYIFANMAFLQTGPGTTVFGTGTAR